MAAAAELGSRQCRRCGAPLAGDELSGNCPRCLTALLLSPEPADAVDSSAKPILRRLGDYELLAEIARGGMGIVFRARQMSLDRTVAVKVLRDAWLATPVQVKRFRAEAANAAKLKHPNIVAVHEVGEQGGQHFFAMDLVEGKDLAELTRQAPLPPRGAAGLVRKVAEAVQHAHQQGVLHRDLKPSNVLLDPQGEPQVTDFGLARALDEDSSLTVTGQVLGTPGYMAPEQAKGGGTAGPAADVYGLGALLFHLLTGRAPFVGASAAETLTQVLQQEPLSPRLLNPAVPVDLAVVCLKCLAKRAGHRYGSAAELAEDLKRFLSGQITHARPAGALERCVRWCRRKPAVAAFLGLTIGTVICGVAVLVLWVHQTHNQAQRQREAAGVLASLLQGLGPQIALARNSRETHRILAEVTSRINREFADEPETKSTLLITVGDTWEAVGEFALAETVFRQALAAQERSQGKENLSAVEVMERIGKSQRLSGQLESSETTLRESLALKRKLRAPLASEAEGLHQLGATLFQRRNFAEAEALLREALRCRRLTSEGSPVAVAATEFELGAVLAVNNGLAEAETLLQSALARQRRTLGDLHPQVARTLRELARIRSQGKRWPEAEAFLKEGLRIERTLLGFDHGETLATEWHLARLARDQGHLAEAQRAYLALLPRMELAWGKDHFAVLTFRASLARLQEACGLKAAALTNWLCLLAADFEPDQIIRGIEGLLAPQFLEPLFCAAPDSFLTWRFTTNSPPAGWQTPGFPDLDWPQAQSPFGSIDTAARTIWETPRLCLRSEFASRPEAKRVIVRASHDDSLSLWLNGVLAATNAVWSFGCHWLYPIPEAAVRTLNTTNTLAVEIVNYNEGAYADVELYVADRDADAPLRQLAKDLSTQIEQHPKEFGWLRARGRVWLALGKGAEAAADFSGALLVLARGVDTYKLAEAQLKGLQGEAKLLAAEQRIASNDYHNARSDLQTAVGLLRDSRSKLASCASINDWQYADVSALLGGALTLQARLEANDTALLSEAEDLLAASWSVLEKTSRFPEALRPQRRKRLARYLAAVYDLKAALAGNPQYELEANHWREVSATP